MQARAHLASLILIAIAGTGEAAQTASHGPASSSPALKRPLAGVHTTELAGVALSGAPGFDFRRTFQESEPIEVAVDPGLFPQVVGASGELYVVASKSMAEWSLDAALVDVSGAVEQVTFGATLAANVFQVDAGTLAGVAGLEFGVPYDVVVDLDGDALLSSGDLIDGVHEPGVFVVRDPTLPGPLAVSEALYTFGLAFTGQQVFYPTSIASLGELPVVFVSHGNGQSFQWYEHIGYHLASHGFLVVSHETNTAPGVQSAAASTVQNTDLFLGNLSTLLGGVLAGHADTSRLVWIGQGRGGEGVVVAARDVASGALSASNFDGADLVLVAAIAPSDLLGLPKSDPGTTPFALIAGAADPSMDGCAGSNATQPFHLYERADGARQSLYLHGVGYSDFAAGPGGVGGVGPCLVGQTDTHQILRGYLLPLVERYARASLAAEDFLWRPWETFRPLGAPSSSCVVVDLEYRPASEALVIDDFQTQPSTAVASSGGAVTTDLDSLAEDRLDDPDAEFTHVDGQEMNGMTLGGPLDDTRGAVLSFQGERFLAFDLPGAPLDAGAFRYLSFRAAQGTRHPLTISALADLTFDVRLEDAGGNSATLSAGAYGGGIEEPYQRTGCGIGAGWANEFEVVRLRLGDFRGVDLKALTRVVFLFGPSHGSPEGRLGLDEIRLTAD